MIPQFVPATPATEQFAPIDGSSAALQALALADAIRAAGDIAFGAHGLDVRVAR